MCVCVSVRVSARVYIGDSINSADRRDIYWELLANLPHRKLSRVYMCVCACVCKKKTMMMMMMNKMKMAVLHQQLLNPTRSVHLYSIYHQSNKAHSHCFHGYWGPSHS